MNSNELAVRASAPVDRAAGPVINSPTQLVAAAFLAGYTGRTREAYDTDLRQFFDWCACVQVDPLAAARMHVQVYIRELEERLVASSIARKLSALSGFYSYAAAEDLIKRSPMTGLRRPKVSDESPRFGLDRHELARLLEVANTHSPVAYALVCLLAFNGLRVSEACKATVADLAEERGHRLLTVTRKGGKRARIPLAPRTIEAIAALPSMTDVGASAPVGASALLFGIDRFAAWRLIRRLAYSAGISKPISPHSLRHTYVTLSLDAGVELRDVQDGAGHADPRTTRRYDRGRNSLDRAPTYRLAAYVDVDEDVA